MNLELIDFLALDSTRESLDTLLVDRQLQYHLKPFEYINRNRVVNVNQRDSGIFLQLITLKKIRLSFEGP